MRKVVIDFNPKELDTLAHCVGARLAQDIMGDAIIDRTRTVKLDNLLKKILFLRRNHRLSAAYDAQQSLPLITPKP